MNILEWVKSLFPSDEVERKRGYEYCRAELEWGVDVDTLRVQADCPFDPTPFDSGMRDALMDWNQVLE